MFNVLPIMENEDTMNILRWWL